MSFVGWSAFRTGGLARRPHTRLRGQRRSHERRFTTGAVARDRRKIAADIHDLVMQDLSFALATARTLLDDPELGPQAGIVVAAGERALAGARDVVNGLVSHERRPIAESVETSVREAARKAPLRFEMMGVRASVQPDQPTHDALVHIGREAVTNAIKYAGSHADVEVILEHDDEWRLTVRDSGSGFDLGATSPGFGLQSMRARARELGGSLRVTSAKGMGSMVEATLP